MVARVQHVDGEYRVVLTPEQVAALKLSDGAAVVLEPVAEPVEHTYVSVEEGLDAFRRTEHLHRNTYRELAK